MTKPVALLDVDGVFADFSGKYVETIAALFGRSRIEGRGPVDRWEIHHWAELTREEQRVVDELVSSCEGWCRSIQPLPGAVEAMARLREEAECIVVTAAWSGPFWHKERLDWIAEHMGVDHKHVIFAHRKDRIDGDLILDDKPQNVIDWARAAAWRRRGGLFPDAMPLLWHTPYNASVKTPPEIGRVFRWEDVFSAIERMWEGR